MAERDNEKQNFVDSDHVWKLTANLLQLQMEGTFCDVELVCSDGVVMGKWFYYITAYWLTDEC